MKIGEFSKINNLTIDTVRHYMDTALLIPEKHGGQYNFDSKCQNDLRDVLTLKEMGFSLKDIKSILMFKRLANLTQYQETECFQTFFINKYQQIDTKIKELNLVKQKLEAKLNDLSDTAVKDSSVLGINIKSLNPLLQLFMNFNLNHNNENTEEIEKSINFFTNIIDGATYLKANRDIVTVFKILTTLNFFIGLSINVPMPYIINNVLNLSTKFFGIIEASFPIGMILGALIIRKILNKYSYQKIIKSASILLCFCMIAIGFSSIIHYAVYNKAIYLIYFILIMVLSGISISSIDILIFYVIQETVPDIFKGRVLSIGISIAKIILPIALIISGTLIDIIPTYILPIISGIGFFVFTIFYINPNIQNNIKGI